MWCSSSSSNNNNNNNNNNKNNNDNNYRTALLGLLGEHAEVEVDQLQIAGGCGVVTSLQLVIEPLGHGGHTHVDVHTHLGHALLQGGDTHSTRKGKK